MFELAQIQALATRSIDLAKLNLICGEIIGIVRYLSKVSSGLGGLLTYPDTVGEEAFNVMTHETFPLSGAIPSIACVALVSSAAGALR
jgi:hypothetical protein